MNSTERRLDSESHCHCGAAYGGVDHCPECFCEQYEATCDHRAHRVRQGGRVGTVVHTGFVTCEVRWDNERFAVNVNRDDLDWDSLEQRS